MITHTSNKNQLKKMFSLHFSENVCKWALGVEGLTLVGPGTKKFKKHCPRSSQVYTLANVSVWSPVISPFSPKV